jgi:hypothetical protein
VIPYLLFFILGLAFGYAATVKWKWLPLLFPLVLALGAALSAGFDGTLIFRLIVALLITAAGVLIGAVLDRRGGGQPDAKYA